MFLVKVDDFGCQVSFQNENLSQTASVHQQTTHRNIWYIKDFWLLLQAHRCELQLNVISARVRDLKVRLARALQKDKQGLAYSFQMQLNTAEGVKTMYTESLARKLIKLQRLEAYSL